MTDNFIGGVVCAATVIAVFVLGVSLGIRGAELRLEREAILTNHAEIINGEFKWKELCK